jgi:tetratricopeptide (TPR) repeat protein
MATAQCEKTLAIDPGFVNAHTQLSEIYMARGVYDKAVDEFLATERLRRGGPDKAETPEDQILRKAFNDGGISGFWRALAARYVQPPQYYAAARQYARLGDHQTAANCLLKAVETHDLGMISFAADPLFDEYHLGHNEIDFPDRLLPGPE